MSVKRNGQAGRACTSGARVGHPKQVEKSALRSNVLCRTLQQSTVERSRAQQRRVSTQSKVRLSAWACALRMESDRPRLSCGLSFSCGKRAVGIDKSLIGDIAKWESLRTELRTAAYLTPYPFPPHRLPPPTLSPWPRSNSSNRRRTTSALPSQTASPPVPPAPVSVFSSVLSRTRSRHTTVVRSVSLPDPAAPLPCSVRTFTLALALSLALVSCSLADTFVSVCFRSCHGRYLFLHRLDRRQLPGKVRCD